MSGHTAPSKGTVRAGRQSPVASTSARCSLSGLPSEYAAKRAPLARGPQDGDSFSEQGGRHVTGSAVWAGSYTRWAGLWTSGYASVEKSGHTVGNRVSSPSTTPSPVVVLRLGLDKPPIEVWWSEPLGAIPAASVISGPGEGPR